MVAVASAVRTQASTPNLPSHRDPYYAGKWQKPKADRYVDTISPGTGESLGKVVDGSVADAEAAIAAAKAAFKEWRRVPPLERAKMLRAIADVLRKNGDELAMIDAADCGNPYAEMVRDAQAGAAQLDFYAGLVTEMKGASIPMGPDVVNFSVREPFGVVGRIIPFNHPFMFAAGKSAAPLAAGNTVVLKPPEQAPLSALRLAELIDGILPPGVWNVVPGGREVGQVLASHPDVAKVALIGSVPTGRAVMKAAADTLKPVLARTRRQECADRLPRRRSRGGLRRRGRRHELHLVRTVLRLDQPRLRAREDLRRRARAREELGQALQARHSDRSRDHHGLDRQPGAVRPGAELHRGRQGGRRAARQRRQAAGRSRSSPRASSSSPPSSPMSPWTCASARRKSSGRCSRSSNGATRTRCSAQVNQVEYGLTCSIWTNDLVDRAPHRGGGRGRLSSGSTRCRSISSARRSAATSSPASGARNASRSCCSFTREKNIHVNLKRRSGAH